MSERHHYISTACQHGLHGQCRERCKFCDAKCQCTQCSHSALAQPGPSPNEKRTAACYPTPDEINALPEKFRQYIHDLETRTDKSGDVQTIALLREDREALQKRMEELQSGLEGLLPKHDFGLFIEHNAHRGYYESAERYLEGSEGDISDEMRKRCIETDQIWRLQWYPDNATSFYRAYAPTLREALEAAKDE